ncbi:hypothetical protein DFJ73DRAFT_959062 [Zopfochytrium polystomum]|nr:hypothetical protein DFJ73DRAFT_959062 [Zopfochytrium polystomum]
MFDTVEVDSEYALIAVHPLIPIWAGAKHSGRVELYFDDSLQLAKSAFQKEAVSPALLVWHPSRRFLAAAWTSGVVGVWSEMEETLREGTAHRSRVTCLEWSGSGSRLISGDEEGEVTVWKIDNRGKMTSVCQYRLKTMLTHCVFRRMASKIESRQSSLECTSFYLASLSGKIFFADDMGRCSEAGACSSKVFSAKLFESRDTFVVITEDFSLSQFALTPDGKMNLENEIKISTVSGIDLRGPQLTWLSDGILAFISGAGASGIRILDIFDEENTTIPCPVKEDRGFQALTYCNSKNLLAAGTDSGSIYVWKHSRKLAENSGAQNAWQDWTSVSTGPATIESLFWGASGTILIAHKRASVKILAEQKLSVACYKGTTILQTSSTTLALQRGRLQPLEIEIADRVKQVVIFANTFAVTNGACVNVYECTDDLSSARLLSAITSDSALICLDQQSVMIASNQKVDIYSLSGTLKNSLSIGLSDGTIRELTSSATCLALGTSKNTVKIYDISRREPRFVTSKSSPLAAKNVSCIAVNSSGTLVSFIAAPENDDGHFIVVYVIERDVFFDFDCAAIEVLPISLRWDTSDRRILVCETDKNEVASFFVSSEHGIILHERYTKRADTDSLIGVHMPFHYFVASGAVVPTVNRQVSPDFSDLDDPDPSITAAMIEFAFQIDTGNLDDAFKALQCVENDRVWKNLARICVKRMRVDVAIICLCKIRHVKAIAALRRIDDEKSLELKAATLAIFLDMHEEVQQIYTKLGRYDLLNLYHQESGQWNKALDVASKFDRINFRATFVKFGRYLLETGDKAGALSAFEKAFAVSAEMPQSVFESEYHMKTYTMDSKDKSLKRWWGQYEETRGNYVEALRFYEDAEDVLSIVRLHCAAGKIARVRTKYLARSAHSAKAIDLARGSSNAAASYYIARQFEKEGKISDAINFYGQAKCYTQAIRLAKEHHQHGFLISFALQGNRDTMLDAAEFLEKSSQNIDKAIIMYHRAGHSGKAIELCFQHREFSTLEEIGGSFHLHLAETERTSPVAESLGPDADPTLLQKCANFFINNKLFEKAVRLLASAKRHKEVRIQLEKLALTAAKALRLCVQENVVVTEELADQLGGSPEGSESDAALLVQVGELCLQQKSYHLACKKFAQGGELIRAMKALLKSGDTERIIFFANVSGMKQKEIYVVAANYLQTLDWRSNPPIMKAIITFYTKSRSFESLAGFYEACCHVEVDEYQNYEKGLSALREAVKCLSKAKDTMQNHEKARVLSVRVEQMEAFIGAKLISKTNVQEMDRMCEVLLEEPDIDSAVRAGDVFALMIETHFQAGNIQRARDLLFALQSRVSAAGLDYYVDSNVLQALRQDQPGMNTRKLQDVGDVAEDIRAGSEED